MHDGAKDRKCRRRSCADDFELSFHELNALVKKIAAGLGGGRPPRTRSGDGEGWGRDRERVFLSRMLSAMRQWPAQHVTRRAKPKRSDRFATAVSRNGS